MSGPKTSQLEIERMIAAQLEALRSDVDDATARARGGGAGARRPAAGPPSSAVLRPPVPNLTRRTGRMARREKTRARLPSPRRTMSGRPSPTSTPLLP